MSRVAWNKGKQMPSLRGNTHAQGHTPWNKGKSHLKNENHGMWKGDTVGYRALHYWVERQLGKPKQCSNCGLESDRPKQFHWANVSGEYHRDTQDWVRLCVKCHWAKDDIANKTWKTRRQHVVA